MATVPRKRKNAMVDIKVVFLGDPGVGKTSLLCRYTENEFPTEDTIPTIIDSYGKLLRVEKKPCSLGLMDTSSAEADSRARRLIFPCTHVFVLCYSVVDPQSLDNVRTKWLQEISPFSKDSAFVVVGTKTDLRARGTLARLVGSRESVSPETGAKLSKEVGAAKYLECSALEGDNLVPVFKSITRVALSVIAEREKHMGYSLHDMKLVVVGSAGVGKTCLLLTFLEGRFPHSSDDNVPASLEADSLIVRKKKHAVSLGVWDTNTGAEYTRLRPLNYALANAFLLCFDVSDRATLDAVGEQWLPEVRARCPDALCLLVGTKTDLRDAAGAGARLAARGATTPVTAEEGEAAAAALGAVAYLEVSSLAGGKSGVEPVFHRAIMEVFQAKAAAAAHGGESKTDAAGECVMQ